jgi:hypothetical protein
MVSDRELLKPEHIEQVIHEEILMYDEDKKVFVPCADYTEELKLRFYELMKRKTRCLTAPTQKIKS